MSDAFVHDQALAAPVSCPGLATGGVCTIGPAGEELQQLVVPDGVTQLYATLRGGSGGTGRLQGAAGRGSSMLVSFPVVAGQVVDLYVGLAGTDTGGWGYAVGGSRGTTPEARNGHDGGSGGGATAILLDGEATPLVVAGGGGGAGGDGNFGQASDIPGGTGGDGGLAPTDGGDGQSGEPKYFPPAAGGTGGSSGSTRGDKGGDSDEVGGGAGGGGGGGYLHGGGSGRPGSAAFITSGGGGGGGRSFVAGEVSVVGAGPAEPPGDGFIQLFAGDPVEFFCAADNAIQSYALPEGTTSMVVFASGAQGGHGNDARGVLGGLGAEVVATVDTSTIDVVNFRVGCAGDQGGYGAGAGGRGGDGGPGVAGLDGGRGGGATNVWDAASGRTLVAAGGGGGAGGNTYYTAGNGGDAGLAFGRGGAEPGFAPLVTGGPANACGACAKVPDGGPGSGTDVGGGGGGGGGGWHQGGDGGGADVTGGSGGGGGASYVDRAYVEEATISTGGEDNGLLVLFPVVSTASLTVEKAVTGPAAAYGPGPFEMAARCVDHSQTVLDQTFTLAPSTNRTFADLPVGASCTVTETGTGGATTAAPPQTIASLPAGDSRVVMTNTFDDTQVEVTVSTVGQRPDFVIPGYRVTIGCSFNGRRVPIPAPAVDGVLVFPAGTTRVDLSDLPVGSRCRLAETATGGATEIEYAATNPDIAPSSTPLQFQLGTGATQVAVTNTFVRSSLTVTKTVTGSPPPLVVPFTVAVACRFNGQPVTIDTASFHLEVGQSHAVDDLPVGATCTVDETGPVDATSVTYAPSRSATITPDGRTIDITNDYSTGSLIVTKTLSGAGAIYANQPFTVDVDCVLGPDTLRYTLDFPAAGGPPITPLPALVAGTSCRIVEGEGTGATATTYRVGATTSPTPPTVTVVDGAATVVAIDNEFAAAPLRVVTTTTGDGAAFANADTVTEISCSFNDDTIFERSLRMPPQGGAADIEGLPVGAVCDVAQVDDAGATVHYYTVVNGSDTTTDPSATTTILAPDAGGPTTVTVTDLFEVAPLEISKDVTGAAAWAANTDVTAAAACIFNDLPLTHVGPGGVVRVQFTSDGTPVDSPGWIALDSLPVNTLCNITEPVDGSATAVAFEPPGPTPERSAPVLVTSVADDVEPAQARITNRFDTGSITVDKAIAGGGAVDHQATQFILDLACTFNGVRLPAPPAAGVGYWTIAVDGDGSRTFDQLPQRATCTVTEIDDGDATSTTIAPATPVTLGATPTAVTVSNVFEVGDVLVTAALEGPGAATYGSSGTYIAVVTCVRSLRGRIVDVPLPGGGVVVLDAGNQLRSTIQRVPVGVTCGIDEVDWGLATSSTRSEPLMITAGGPNTLQLVNRFAVGRLDITKRVVGEAPAGAVFTVAVSCTAVNADGVTVAVPLVDAASVRLAAGETRSVLALTGAQCDLAETDTGGAISTVITPGADTVRVQPVLLDVSGPAAVVVENRFAAPTSTTTTMVTTSTTSTSTTVASPPTTRPRTTRPNTGSRLAKTGGDLTTALGGLLVLAIGLALIAASRRGRRSA